MNRTLRLLSLFGILGAALLPSPALSAGLFDGVDIPMYYPLKNKPYGPDPAQYFDAYIPTSPRGARVIVYIHGGGWTGGDKGELPQFLIDELVGRRQYVVVSINYRLVSGGQNRFPTQIDDVRRALAYLTEKSKQYPYNGDEFVLWGGSAGGHLAMLYAYGYDDLHQVKAVIDYWGPTDFTDPAARPANSKADLTVLNFLGEDADPTKPICQEASPYHRLTAKSGVPTILFHGADDDLVVASQAQKMADKLTALGVPNELHLYPKEGHGLSSAALPDVVRHTLRWLEKYYPAHQ